MYAMYAMYAMGDTYISIYIYMLYIYGVCHVSLCIAKHGYVLLWIAMYKNSNPISKYFRDVVRKYALIQMKVILLYIT